MQTHEGGDKVLLSKAFDLLKAFGWSNLIPRSKIHHDIVLVVCFLFLKLALQVLLMQEFTWPVCLTSAARSLAFPTLFSYQISRSTIHSAYTEPGLRFECFGRPRIRFFFFLVEPVLNTLIWIRDQFFFHQFAEYIVQSLKGVNIS